jgi:hypothetical protein
LYPKGFGIGLTNFKYKIFIKEVSVKHDKDSSYRENKYTIQIYFNGKVYKQTLTGFCGS